MGLFVNVLIKLQIEIEKLLFLLMFSLLLLGIVKLKFEVLIGKFFFLFS